MSENDKEETPIDDPVAHFFGQESEPQPEPEMVEQEVVEEAEPEQTELPGGEEAVDSDPRPDKSDLIDKELQRIQQARATYEREIDKLQANPTEKQADRVEKAKGKLDSILEASVNDIDPYQGVSDVAGEVKADRDRVERLLQQQDADRKAYEERVARLEAQNAQMQFAMDYPDLRGRYNELAGKAHEALVESVGDEVYELPAHTYTKLANREFMRLVKEASGNVAASPEKEKKAISDTSKKPKAANIIKTKSGNSVKPPEDREAAAEKLLQQMGGEYFGG